MTYQYLILPAYSGTYFVLTASRKELDACSGSKLCNYAMFFVIAAEHERYLYHITIRNQTDTHSLSFNTSKPLATVNMPPIGSAFKHGTRDGNSALIT